MHQSFASVQYHTGMMFMVSDCMNVFSLLVASLNRSTAASCRSTGTTMRVGAIPMRSLLVSSVCLSMARRCAASEVLSSAVVNRLL
ncbi:hypothetical protein D3C72_1122180 [compost metagenome]